MARKSMNPVVRAITDAMWKRDRLQMRAVDTLLSLAAPARRRRTKPRRRPAAKGRQ